MAKLNALTHSFSQGEVSTAALARVDQERLRLAAEIQENLLPHVVGKGLVRPGTLYLGATASSNKARLFPFVKSPTDTALLEFSSALLRVWISDTLLTRPSVTSTVTNGTFATASATITVTIASPGVVTWTSHGFAGNEPIVFTTTGALPTGLTAGTTYYVRATGLTANTFTVSATAGGAAINTSGVQSGVHTGYYGWTPTTTTGATAAITSGALELQASARGSSAYVDQAVTTSSSGTEHGLRITVTRGPVLFRCGSSSGAEDYISETSLGTGTHSLAFTPSAGTYYVRFTTRTDRKALIDSIAVESAGTVTLAAPWSESDLPLVRVAQSIDTVFLACQSWQQRKIERRGTTGRSWSLVVYETEDGPFVTAATNNVKISASGSYGLVTLTASANLFSSSYVGSLLKVEPRGYGATFLLAGEDQYTDAVRLYGAGRDKWFVVTTTGTWSGTLSVQMSLDGATSGFTDMQPNVGTPWQKTTNHTAQTFSVDDAYNNVPVWIRIGFKPGEYTSGSASITITYGGSGQSGVYRITAYTSATSVEAQVLSAPGSTANTDVWSWGAWSDVNGWPSAVGFFDGRLFWGGPDKFWGSESDNYYAFNLDDEGASGSIQRSLATGGTINRIKWLLPLQRLIFGSDGAEISARSSSFDEPLTPTNVTLKDAATQGVSAISPAKVDGRGFYVHRDGIRLFEIAYDVESNDYRVNSIMLLNDTIGGTGLSELAVQRSPESYIWTVRADGVCPCLIYDPKEKTAGWFKFIAAPSAAGDAVVESVAVLPSSGQDRVYLAVKRTINGSVVRYIEKLAKHSEARGDSTTKMGDSGVTNAGPVTTFSGLSHLIGENVVAWGTTGGVTGPIGTTYTVNGSGEITLPSSSTNVTVGLAYTWRYKSAKLAFGMEGGTSLLRPKRVGEIGLLLGVHHPNAIQYGSDFTTMFYMPRVEDGQDITATTVRSIYDEKAFSFGGGWDTDSRVCLKGSAPYPAEILALVTSVEVGTD